MTLRSVAEVAREARAWPDRYIEFLRQPSMSAGVYVLPASSVDRQSPHREDEIYYVAQGRGRFRNSEGERAVAPGDVLYVPAGEAHQFFDIQEELVLLVVFAPSEGRGSPGPSAGPATVRTPPP